MKNNFLFIFAILLIISSSNYYFQTHVRTRVYIVNNCVNEQKVKEELNKLNTEFYSGSNIIIMLDAVNNIYKNIYNNLQTGNYTCSTMESDIFNNNDAHSLNIYIVPNIQNGAKGFARNIPGNGCVIAANYFGGSTPAHEVGHCLGLFHTSDQCSNGKENITRNTNDPYYNADVAGDLVTDTYPYVYGNDGDPYDESGAQYPTSANPYNIMNREGGTRNIFTEGQIIRMKAILQNNLSYITYNPIKKVLAKNNFVGTGKIIVDNDINNPIIIPESGKLFDTWYHSSYPHFFEAIDNQYPTGNPYKQIFQYWKIQNDIYSTRKVIVHSPASFITDNYTANFLSEYNITFTNNHSGGEVGGEFEVKINNNSYSPYKSPTSTIHVLYGSKITVKAENHYLQGIYFEFDHWSHGGSTSKETTFSPSGHENYKAYFTGRPTNSYRNQHFNTNVTGQHIKVYWSQHPNSNVEKYKIYRKTKFSSEVCVATIYRTGSSSHTYSWTDPIYVYTNNTSSTNLLSYDVRAFYAPDAALSDYDWRSVYGEEDIGGPINEQQAEEGAMLIDNNNYEYGISNYPNPYNPTTTISYSVKDQGNVNIVVYDALGRKIKELVNETKQPGSYTVNFDGSNLSSGIYFYTMRVNNFTTSKKMILSK